MINEAEKLLNTARAAYLQIIDPQCQPHTLVGALEIIDCYLEEHGADESALDTSGIPTKISIAEQLSQLRKKAALVKAWDIFPSNWYMDGFLFEEDCRRSLSDRDIADIRRHLQDAGRDAAALDPAEKHTAEEIETMLQEANREYHLGKARQYFNEATRREDAMQSALDHLRRANADESALDLSGKADRATMAAELARRHQFLVDVKTQLEADVRAVFAGFLSGNIEERQSADILCSSFEVDKKVTEALKGDCAALDPTGTLSSDEVKARVIAARKEMGVAAYAEALKAKFGVGSNPGREDL